MSLNDLPKDRRWITLPDDFPLNHKEQRIMTILEIWAITWVFAVDEPYHRPSPAHTAALRMWQANGYIEPNPDSNSGWRCTAKGQDFINRLRKVTMVADSETLPDLDAVLGAACLQRDVRYHDRDDVRVVGYSRDVISPTTETLTLQLHIPAPKDSKRDAREAKLAELNPTHLRAMVRGLMQEMSGEPSFRADYVQDTIECVGKYLITGNTNGRWSDLQCGVAHEVAKVFGFNEMF